jgi:hypothetical protein
VGLGGALLDGCSSASHPEGEPIGGYTLSAGSIATGTIASFTLAGSSLGEVAPGGRLPDISPPLATGDRFTTSYRAPSSQGTGQVIEGGELLLFKDLPVLGTRGLIISANDGRTGVAAINTTGQTLYRLDLVPASAPPFDKTSGGWEFLRVFPGGWAPGDAVFLVGLRSDLPRGDFRRRYRSITGYTAAGRAVALDISEEIEAAT